MENGRGTGKDMTAEEDRVMRSEAANAAIPANNPEEETSSPANHTNPSSADVGLQALPTMQGTAMPTSHSQLPPSTAGSLVGSSSTGFRPSTQGSRTPAGTLTPRAFFQPLSSQHLQATRGTRPLSWQNAAVRDLDDVEDTRTTTNRNSTGSALTTKNPQGVTTRYDLETLPPASRGTDYTEWMTSIEKSNGYTKLVGNGHATTPDADNAAQRNQEDYSTTSHVAKGQVSEREQLEEQGRDRTERSFISNLKWPGKANGIKAKSNGHEKLASQESNAGRGEAELREATSKDAGKNYQYFTGNTMFCFGGRLQNARDKPIVIITGILVLLPSLLFYGYSAPWLWHHVSPAVPLFFTYLFFICISSYLHGSLSDPGILPRNLHSFPPPNPNDDALALAPPTTEWVMVRSAVAQHGAFEVPTKYCKPCNLWRPPRCHHCRVCDNCVDTQDHHCMWLNNCVGRRNYRYFFGFVASGTALGIFLFAASIGHVIAWRNLHHTSTATAINHNRVPFAMFMYGLIAFMYPASLWGYHMFLMSRGQTTREFLNSNKFMKKDRHRPFNQKSVWRNWLVVLLRPRPPTYLQFKNKYSEGDQRFGVRRDQKFAPFQRPRQANGGVEMQQLGAGPPSFQGPAGRGPIDRTPREGIDVVNRP